MSMIDCPYCGTTIHHGYTVCTGCHAVIEYGPPKWIGVPLMLVGALIGISASSWMAFFGIFLGGLFAASYLFRNSVRATR